MGDGRSGYYRGEVIALDDTKTRIITAAIKAVRQYGLEGVRIQNVSELAGISIQCGKSRTKPHYTVERLRCQ